MFEKLEISRMAHALASHAMTRQGAIAQNVANADTPGYRAVDTASFADSYSDQGSFAARATRPGHFGATALPVGFAVTPRPAAGSASPNGNSVSLEAEMMQAAQVRQQYDMALGIAKSVAGILRTSLGRR